jgi:hypothetical protein
MKELTTSANNLPQLYFKGRELRISHEVLAHISRLGLDLSNSEFDYLTPTLSVMDETLGKSWGFYGDSYRYHIIPDSILEEDVPRLQSLILDQLGGMLIGLNINIVTGDLTEMVKVLVPSYD